MKLVFDYNFTFIISKVQCVASWLHVLEGSSRVSANHSDDVPVQQKLPEPGDKRNNSLSGKCDRPAAFRRAAPLSRQ